MSIAEFKAGLHDVIHKCTLNEANWTNPLWELTPTQEMLNDAYAQQGVVRKIFDGIDLILRPGPKSIDRVNQKIAEERVKQRFFRPLSDWIAFRIHHNSLLEIKATIGKIQRIVAEHQGYMWIRGQSEACPYGSHWDGKSFQDITQYGYVFLPEVGYLIELQIGHPFASFTFARDSLLRDNPQCGEVDLWKDGFYNDVKQHILDLANGKEPSLSKEKLVEKAQRIHGGKIPADLETILNALAVPSQETGELNPL